MDVLSALKTFAKENKKIAVVGAALLAIIILIVVTG